MLNLDTSKTPVSPATETGSQSHLAGDDALSQAMLRILEMVAGPNYGSGGRGSAKIAEDVKRAEHQNRDRERGKNKRDLEPLSSVQRPKKRVRSEGPVRVGTLATATGLQPYGDYGRHHPGECWRRIGVCLRCGSLEHCIRDCPQRADQIFVYSRGQFCSHLGAGVRPGVVMVWAEGREHRAEVLDRLRRDIGSTHSYIVSSVSENLGIMVERTTSVVTVLSLLGQFVWVSKLYRDVPLVVQGTIFLADLMELPFGKFDIILGIDWLDKHRVSLDCATRTVILRTKEDEEVVVIGERQDYLSHVISTLVVKSLVQKACEAYLAYVSTTISGNSSIKDIRTVRDFSDVFPEELLGLPSN
ncbi:uncharacterized protein [Gossypium hirsutum]|uniref:CCHC-type domain-containing protein n=1 Tax=Gossypium hirsutum TaxID=3635 RepID=A0A1U8HTP7_GOSHI|nr:uncharacterized protein LOC107887596 [Gossypium hirsutum]